MYLEPEQVDAILAGNGSKIATVTFEKKSGEVTTRTGLPKVYSRRVGNERGKAQAARLAGSNQRFWDYPKVSVDAGQQPKNGFSFFTDRVLSIQAGKKLYTPEPPEGPATQ